MAFECVHCKAVIEDDSLKLPRSGAVCPHCKKDPTEGWSPYPPEVAEEAHKLAEEMHLRIMTRADWGVQEATLYFLEELMLEERHQVSIRLGGKPQREQRCGVCGKAVPAGEGFRLEIYDHWRVTGIQIGLCERHAAEGLWGQDLDLHANHPDPYLTRGDWTYPTSGREGGGEA